MLARHPGQQRMQYVLSFSTNISYPYRRSAPCFTSC